MASKRSDRESPAAADQPRGIRPRRAGTPGETTPDDASSFEAVSGRRRVWRRRTWWRWLLSLAVVLATLIATAVAAIGVAFPNGWQTSARLGIESIGDYPVTPVPTPDDLKAWLATPDAVAHFRERLAGRTPFADRDLTAGDIERAIWFADWGTNPDFGSNEQQNAADATAFYYDIHAFTRDRWTSPAIIRAALQPIEDGFLSRAPTDVRDTVIKPAVAKLEADVQKATADLAAADAAADRQAISRSRRELNDSRRALAKLKPLVEAETPLYLVDWEMTPSDAYFTGFVPPWLPEWLPAWAFWLAGLVSLAIGLLTLRAIWTVVDDPSKPRPTRRQWWLRWTAVPLATAATLGLAGFALAAIWSPKGWASSGTLIIQPADEFPVQPLPTPSKIEDWLCTPDSLAELKGKWRTEVAFDRGDVTAERLRGGLSFGDWGPDWYDGVDAFYSMTFTADSKDTPRGVLSPAAELIERELNASVTPDDRQRAVANATGHWTEIVELREKFVEQDRVDSIDPSRFDPARNANQRELTRYEERLKQAARLLDPDVPLYEVRWGGQPAAPSRPYEVGFTPRWVPPWLLWLALLTTLAGGIAAVRAIWRSTAPAAPAGA